MTKLGNAGALNDGVDTSVPGIEASDLNDGDILARTRENVNPNGQFQFIYIPEDGSEQIVSDWLGQDHKKKAVIPWIEGVKGAIIGRGQAKLHAANSARLADKEAQMESELLASRGELVVEDLPEPPPRRAQPRVPARVAAPTVGADMYIAEQLEIAEQRLYAAEEQQRDITREVINARRDAAKWRTLRAALEGDNDSSRGHSRPSGVSDNDTGVDLSPSLGSGRGVRGVNAPLQLLPSLHGGRQVRDDV